MKKLKDPEEPIDRLFTRMRGLGRHLGPVLYQLPSGWRADVDRFAHFLDALPRQVRHVVEFRDPSWNVTVDSRADGSPPRLDVPSRYARVGDRQGSRRPIVYVRFHGTTGKYEGGYSSERLRGWAAWLNAQRAAGCDVYAYFNNDVGGQAPRDAVALMRAMQDAEP